MQPHLVDARVLDLFAGSGALGLEALSRGAATADFVENAAASLRVIAGNIATLGAGASAHVHRADAFRFLDTVAEHAYDVAFADPPYRLGLAAQVAERWIARPFARVLGIEHARSEALPDGGSARHYGDTAITIYRAPSTAAES